jgi:hypothetical protein
VARLGSSTPSRRHCSRAASSFRAGNPRWTASCCISEVCHLEAVVSIESGILFQQPEGEKEREEVQKRRRERRYEREGEQRSSCFWGRRKGWNIQHGNLPPFRLNRWPLFLFRITNLGNGREVKSAPHPPRHSPPRHCFYHHLTEHSPTA